MITLFVGNLPWSVRGKQLREHFEKFGEVGRSTVILERENKSRSRGFGFIEFVNREDGEKAIEEMNGSEWMERELVVNEAQPREDDGERREYAPREDRAETTAPAEDAPSIMDDDEPLA